MGGPSRDLEAAGQGLQPFEEGLRISDSCLLPLGQLTPTSEPLALTSEPPIKALTQASQGPPRAWIWPRIWPRV